MFLYRTKEYNDKNNIYLSIIRECYIEVLDREPDPSGIITYTRQLKRGWTNFDIKKDLYNSYEGRMKLARKTHHQTIKLFDRQSESQSDNLSKSNNHNMFYERTETENLSDLEFFNFPQKDTLNNDNNTSKEIVSYKNNKGFVNLETSEPTQFIYCIGKSTYNNFYIEDSNEKDCIKIYVKSNNNNLYLKINNTNLTNDILTGSKLLEENFVNNKHVASIFKKIFYKDSNKFHLVVHKSVYIDDTLLNSDVNNKYFVIDNHLNLCKLINDRELTSDTKNILKYWL